MLVLTRRPGEQIVIGTDIRLTVVSVGPGRVKIGIEAPSTVRIDRQEVHEKIQREHAEHGSDVLAAVGRPVSPDEVSPTVVTAGADTSTVLHNRIAEKLPAPAAAPAKDGTDTHVPLAVSTATARPRLPRKSR
jgi:carbon storage regulator